MKRLLVSLTDDPWQMVPVSGEKGRHSSSTVSGTMVEVRSVLAIRGRLTEIAPCQHQKHVQ